MQESTLYTYLQSLPRIILRSQVEELLNGLISRGHLANLDSQGKGPRRIKIGGKVAYFKEDLARWILERASIDHSVEGIKGEGDAQ